MTETRKLSAILAADVVGFSRLTGADEDRTLARLRALRSDLLDPTIAVHNGRVVKRTGDGAIVEFRSVVDAVRCAIEIQNAMVERNAGVPEDRRIQFRIGVHLGDVVEESDGDLMGDGVNIAARLEGVAQPGAICLSEDAYRQVKARLDLSVSDLGATQLKNIAEPVRVYSLQVGLPVQATSSAPSEVRLARTSAAAVLPDKPSIAVLPFANMSGDVEQEYFADGISEDIITALSKLSQLFVIARNSSFTFKGKNVHIGEVGKSLGVRYVLEGSVRKSGDRVRDHRAAHRRDDRRALVGGAVRPRAHRHLRRSGRRDDPHRLGAGAQSHAGRPAKHQPPSIPTIKKPTIASCGGENCFFGPPETRTAKRRRLLRRATELDPQYRARLRLPRRRPRDRLRERLERVAGARASKRPRTPRDMRCASMSASRMRFGRSAWSVFGRATTKRL